MQEVKRDPKYGHIVGPLTCSVEECQGHRKPYHVTLHKLHVQYFSSTRRKNRKRREAKVEATIKKSTKARQQTKRKKKVTTKNASYHYHTGRRGRCSCDKGSS